MNSHLNRYRTLGLLAVLAVSGTLFLAALGPGVAGQPGQSPLSPVPAFAARLSSRLTRIVDESFWMSPLPWAAIGLLLFSALAWTLIRRLRRARPAESESEERSLPPERVP